jgi:glycine cleavage system H protein
MKDFLTYTLDKFTFKVATDRRYNAEGVWVLEEEGLIRVGVSDFFQQHHGDVAFADVTAEGMAVTKDDNLATIETIKVDIDLLSPVNGRIIAVNEALELEAELINQDPYGAGWLAIIEASDWAADLAKLMTPEAYFTHMKSEALAESNQ